MADGSEQPRRLPALEDLLVAFQKSLARAGVRGGSASKAEADFLLGRKAYYQTDALEIDLKVGVHADIDGQRVLVDLDAPPERCSNLRFRVEAEPLEAIQGPALVLTRTNVGAPADEPAKLTLWLIDAEGAPVSGQDLRVFLVGQGAEQPGDPLSVTTDLAGRVALRILPPDSNGIAVASAMIADRERKARWRTAPGSECYVWAETAEREVDESPLRSGLVRIRFDELAVG